MIMPKQFNYMFSRDECGNAAFYFILYSLESLRKNVFQSEHGKGKKF